MQLVCLFQQVRERGAGREGEGGGGEGRGERRERETHTHREYEYAPFIQPHMRESYKKTFISKVCN